MARSGIGYRRARRVLLPVNPEGAFVMEHCLNAGDPFDFVRSGGDTGPVLGGISHRAVRLKSHPRR